MKHATLSPMSRNAAVALAAIAAVAAPLAATATAAHASEVSANDYRWHRWHVETPNSSILRTSDRGRTAHTNHLLVVPDETTVQQAQSERRYGLNSTNSSGHSAVPFVTGTAPSGETPQTLRPVYSLPSRGGSGVIVIIDAYDYATVQNDFNVFSRQFGLACEGSTNITASTNKVLQVVYAKGTKPAANASWNQETALDIEWAHAMAPNAKIVLVEAASAGLSDLFAAVKVANTIPGVREVSMSWGSSEFFGEQTYDSYFSQPGVVYTASSGDTGGVMEYPAASPNVVSTGGTTLHRDGSGSFSGETGWSGAGGGVSAYESRPLYQTGVAGTVGAHRGVPDIAFDADPNSGVSVYDSTPYNGMNGWMVFGGTSVAAPALAGVINSAATSIGSFATGSQVELTLIYANLGNNSTFTDITSGTAGSNAARAGYDFVTGVGTSWTLSGK